MIALDTLTKIYSSASPPQQGSGSGLAWDTPTSRPRRSVSSTRPSSGLGRR
ncbi:MAG: hypothetical protein ACR2QO_06305 [Acidimicrobiales bacterium]